MKFKSVLLFCSIMFILLSTSYASAYVDFVIRRYDPPPSTIIAGEPFEIYYEVENVGYDGTSEVVYSTIYLNNYWWLAVEWDGFPARSYGWVRYRDLRLPNGTYTFMLVMNSTYVVSEPWYWNNVVSSTHTVTGGQPDLTVEYMNVPDNPEAGVPFTIEAKVKNIGWEDIWGEFTARLYVDDEQKAWWRWDDGLGSQWRSILRKELTLPNGTHTIRLVVDPENNIHESDEGNNEISRTRTWTGGQPELEIQYMDVPEDYQAGETFRFEARVKNVGWEDITHEFVIAKLYVDGEQKAWWLVEDGLRSQWYYTMWKELRLPNGTHTFRLVVDPDNMVDESNEDNNEMTKTGTWSGGQPDLTVEYMNVPDNPEAGVPFTVEAKIKNIGWEDITGEFTARLYVDGEQKAWWHWPEGLRSQWRRILHKELTLPNGTHTIRLVVDPENNIHESEEGNNEMSRTRTLTGGQPDLTVEYMNVPDNPEAGVPFTVEAKIKNIGWADITEVFTARLYVDDEQKAWWRWDDGLRSQWRSILHKELTLPGGTHTIRLVVDPEDYIEESEEGNNEMIETRTWGGGSVDFIVSRLDPPSSTIAGEPFEVTARVENIGWAGTSATVYAQLYIDDEPVVYWEWDGYPERAYSEVHTSPVNLQLPAGQHTFRLKMDDSDAVDEGSNEGNNEMSYTVTFTGGEVDFAVTRLDPPSSTTAGEPFEVTARVENIGWAGTSATVHAQLYIDDEPSIYWEWDGYPARAYSELSTSPFSLQLPAGQHIFRLKMDDDNVVDEGSHEENNEMSQSVIFAMSAPSAPTGLDGDAGPGSGQVTLWWNSNPEPDIAYYRIYRGTTSREYDFYYDRIPKDWNRGIIISGLANGIMYYFSVTAINIVELESDFSNEVSIIPILQGDVEPPTIPTNLHIFDPETGNSLEISWSPSVDNVAVSYYLLYRLTNSSDVSATNYDSGFPFVTSMREYVDSAVREGNTYYYRVQAADTSGNRSGLSDTASDGPTDFLAPSFPNNLNTVSGDNSINLTWDAPVVNSDGSELNDLIGYNIYRGESSGNYSEFPINGTTPIIAIHYLDPDLVNETTYYYVVTAVDDAGNESVYSVEASATPELADLPPDPPTNVTLVSRATELALFWNANREPDLLGYNVYRKVQGEGYSDTPLNTAPITSTSYIDRDIDPSLVYFYIVRAIDEAGQESENSNEVFGKVGTGALWIISPTTQAQAVLDFDTQTSPSVIIVYHLNSDYLNLFPEGARVKLEIVSANSQVVYTAWDYDPKGSGHSFNPHFLWNGKDMDGRIVGQGVYTIKISIFSNNQAEEVLVWDRAENAIQVISSGIRVSQVVPNESTKVLISTLHDNDYPSRFQTEDRKIRITAKVEPVNPNANVYFRTFDPDDQSSYETDKKGDDNHHKDPFFRMGNLSVATGYTLIPGSQVIDTNGNVIGLGVKTDSQGLAKVDLLITNRYAGDNYIVRVDTEPNPDTNDPGTGLLVAWKRIYIEEDKMYKVGTDLTVDFIPDGDNDHDTIHVQDTSSLNVGDEIIVFDADHPSGEIARITRIDGNTLTLNIDLSNTYLAGYSSGRGAAVARQADGIYDANVEGRATDAYGALIDGSDGGCFVEIKILPDGGGNVPYRETFPYDRSGTALTAYSNVWFKNIGKDNYTHIVGAANWQVSDGILGVSLHPRNWIFMFIEELKRAYPSGFNIANAESVAHEIGHQFELPHTDHYHPVGVWCHLGPDTDYCIMGYERDRTDEYSEFCFDYPNHLYQTRDFHDGL